jgi:hypothetical protein
MAREANRRKGENMDEVEKAVDEVRNMAKKEKPKE